MDEAYYIEYCLKKIEQKLQWKNSSEWTDYDYKKIEKLIQESSGISISPHTIKRLFGKVKYKKRYNPQIATKNAIAQFIDFESWENLIKNSDPSEIINIKQLNNSKSRNTNSKNRLLISIIIASLLAIGVYTIIYFTKSSINDFQYEFIIDNSSGTVPHTITFNFDFTDPNIDDVIIDFGFDHPNLGRNIKLIDKNRKVLNYTYQIPGVFYPKLIINNIVVDSFMVHAKSNNWLSFFHTEGENNRLWLDNLVENTNNSGILSLSPLDVQNNGGDTNSIYYTSHRNIMDYNISGDNFRFEIKFMNSPDKGGITCFDSDFRIISEKSLSYIRLMEKNCFRYSGMKFSEIILTGEYEDLSHFRFDISSWNILEIIIQNKYVEVKLNNESIYSGKYQKSNGFIKGLDILFKGSGAIDYIKIESLENENKYIEEFD